MVTNYTTPNAQAYQSSTSVNIYEVEMAFRAAQGMLGDLSSQTVLDFGCGTGRSSRLLRQWGAQRVVGVDHNPNMLAVAQSLPSEGIEYRLLQGDPLPKVEKALSAFVLMEIENEPELRRVHRMIARTLPPGGEYVAITNNADAVPYESEQISIRPSLNFEYASGDIVLATIKGPPPFEFKDHYWTPEDYEKTLKAAGFRLRDTKIPTPREGQSTSPSLVLRAVRI